MDKEFAIEDRIRISDQYHWAKGVTGTIAEPPGKGWQGVSRIVEGVSGPIRLYWVEFDEAQMDADGDGPYFSAEINAAFWSLET